MFRTGFLGLYILPQLIKNNEKEWTDVGPLMLEERMSRWMLDYSSWRSARVYGCWDTHAGGALGILGIYSLNLNGLNPLPLGV